MPSAFTSQNGVRPVQVIGVQNRESHAVRDRSQLPRVQLTPSFELVQAPPPMPQLIVPVKVLHPEPEQTPRVNVQGCSRDEGSQREKSREPQSVMVRRTSQPVASLHNGV